MLRTTICFAILMSAGLAYATAPAQVPQTGQTATVPLDPAPAGSDGNLQKGVTWPIPRFIVGSGATTNCITDSLTGLMWVKDLNTVNGGVPAQWENTTLAITYPAAAAVSTFSMSTSNCGFSDWRLPNINELKSLVNLAYSNTATWLNSQGFMNVPTDFYWSSSSYAPSSSDHAWGIYFGDGTVVPDFNASSHYVWPVRGGQ